MGCVVLARLCRVLDFSIVTAWFPGLTPCAIFCRPYGRRAGFERGFASYLIS